MTNSRSLHRVKQLLLCIVALFISLLLLEAAIRIYVVLFRNHSIVLDDELGWRCRPNYRYRGQMMDASGKWYDVNNETDANGFREFGDIASGRTKILIIGDSFTHAVEVSNSNTYCHLLAGLTDLEVFAHGTRGHGTLQEYMILNELFDWIQPDVVLLQYCPNDFINNVLDLERNSIQNNNHMRRPYLTDEGGVVRDTPSSIPRLREFASRHSKLLYFIISRLDLRIAASRQKEGVEHEIRVHGKAHAGFAKSVEITGRLMTMIKARAAGAVVLAFAESNDQPYYDEFIAVLHSAGIKEIQGVPEALRKAAAEGLVVRAKDGSHWNETGHRIVAETLAGQLQEAIPLKPSPKIE